MTQPRAVPPDALHVLVEYELISALQEREHDLAEAQRLARLGSWKWNLGTGEITWSDELHRIHGTDPTQPIRYDAYLTWVHPDDRDRLSGIISETVARGGQFECDYQMITCDGDHRWMKARGEVVLDVNGVAVRGHGTVQDITSDLRTLQRLDELERARGAAGAPSDENHGPDASSADVAGSELTVAELSGVEWSGVVSGGTAEAPAVEMMRAEAERALRRAFDHGELVLHYQPKLSLESGRFTGAEALLRWEDPARGLVPPLDFIPLAEQSGLIVPIGDWVIEEACREAATWQRERPRRPPLVVSVNVSALQVGPNLVRVVEDALRASGSEPHMLCLEVTESTLIADEATAVETLAGIAGLGVKLSIDDFGTGYSSLSYLKRLPLDELKIDKTFVDGLGTDTDDAAIVGATVAMAHALGLSVTAEGVETVEQLERLRVTGCQEAQGYLVSRPVPSAAMTELLVREAEVRWSAPTTGVATASFESPHAPRVLVVDDADDVRQLASMALVAAGFEVHNTSFGTEAVAMATALLPDCVILDVSMPDISGLEVCRALRAHPATKGCTIVMLTANATADDKVAAFSGGADDYIVKPFSPRDLVTRVRDALRHHDDAAAPADPTAPERDPAL